MRIRKPFAGGFVGLCLIAGLAGLSPSEYAQLPAYKQSDKVLHFLTFFVLTFLFYWILETNRRRVVQFTFLVCTVALGFGSEVAQEIIPNGRNFDYYDILANALGSVSSLAICNWYHKRMLERKRAARGYNAVAGDEDIELGEAVVDQESGVIRPTPTVEEELDNWDENAEDWDESEVNEANGGGKETPPSSSGDIGVVDAKKRPD
ncbi:uncharacterized protein BDZ99DRAFT_436054 [Mytilinidion resinicola]|uniref:VanZ-like domain-containing protein n=1 Tax=Mytilinidion resinicola TaxID=574789 RepID=A0A6A6YYU2_9PEZI|nr:uncharacterized protein BDZ99DRAFT_436054 [Mytilinidion resinicola]KAF2813669.1 hypothetical protein BDZ99DRAFT_436054 [Mytilinidion resinicola]